MAGRRRADDGPGPGLSERQQRILDFIQAYAERHGVSPSFREIGDAVGLKAISAVKYQVGQLEEKGHLARRDRMPRTIVAKPRRLRSIPPEFDGSTGRPRFGRHGQHAVVRVGRGRRPGWTPIRTQWTPSGYPGTWWVTETCSRSSVAGDSMVDANIFDGDCLVVRQQDDAVNGDIVAALLGERGQWSRRSGGLRTTSG